MKRIATIASAIGLSLAVAGVASVSAQTKQGTMDHSAMPMGETNAASKSYMDAMTKMNAEMGEMKMTGKSGIDFAMMMIPHHQSAIDMAKAYLESGEGDPELTKLSNDIVAAQESEIALLNAWLEKNAQ